MVISYNLKGLGLVSITLVVWVILALQFPEIGGDMILGISILVLFSLDIFDRCTDVNKLVTTFRANNSNSKNIFKKDMNLSLPKWAVIAISPLGASIMWLPCWLVAVLLGAFLIDMPS